MQNSKILSLRTKLSIFTTILILAVFGFGLVMTLRFFNKTKNSNLENLNLVARFTSEALGEGFGENYKNLKTLANNLNLTSLSQQELQNKLNQTLTWNESWDLIIVVDPLGNYISSSTFDNKGKSADVEALRTIHYNETLWFKSAINNQYSEEKSKNLTGVFVEEMIQDALLSAAFKESRYSSTFTAVVKDSTNQVTAIVSARVNSQWIKKSIQNFYEAIREKQINSFYNSDLEILILDRDFKEITEYSDRLSSNSSSPGANDYSNFSIIEKNGSVSKDNINKLNQIHLRGDGEILLNGKKGRNYFSLEPVTSKKILSHFNWRVLILQSANEFFSKQNITGFVSLIFFIGFMIFALLYVFLILKSFHFNLKSLATELIDTSKKMTTTSFNFNDKSELKVQKTQQQFGSLETMSQSLNQISSTVQENIEMAENATHMSFEINNLTNETQKAMTELKQAMIAIHDSNQRIESLVKIIEEIGEKTEIIDDIVFKTQLLSFNASVEAERAGEHGRGFSVVAQEVGNLAQLSGKAATEIAAIVKNSIREANLVSKDNKSRVIVGENLTKSTSQKLESVTQKLTLIFDITEKISNTSKGQGSGLKNMVQDLSNITFQIKNDSESSFQHSKNIEDLDKLSRKLNSVIDKIKQMDKAS